MLVKRSGTASTPRGDQSVRERAYLLIQQKIARGELLPGSAVSEVSLAQELGSSRTPVREALSQLVAEGLLEQTPHRGAVVIQLRRKDIVDLYELREALEVYAVGKAARKTNTAQELQRLRNFADEILRLRDELPPTPGSLLDARQMHRFITCDLGFHTLLLRMAANPRILKTVNETRLLMRIFSIHRNGHDAGKLSDIYKQHEGIYQAIAGQDPARARDIMAAHIQQSQQERLVEYDQWEHESHMREALPFFLTFHSSGEAF
jgi:DNA-binding GntR family transcriptional regulator